MAKYRKKPVVIDAWRFDGTQKSADELDELSPTIHIYSYMNGVSVTIETLEGTMTVSKGDWVIKGVSGEFYPCKPDIFEKTYEPA